MTINQLAPEERSVELNDLLADFRQSKPRLEPFSQPVIDFASRLSRAIFRDRSAAQYPELQALAYWMRKSELHRLSDEFSRLSTDDTLLVPRGNVFHIPPGNVDTIFVYSWLLSVLAGNRNIIRLSQRATPQADLMCHLFRCAFRESGPELQYNTVIVRYGHDENTSAALSALCDVRVIWGGDATVNRVRRIPIPAHAKELTFADRSSLSVIAAARYLALNQPERARLMEGFFNDVFWFDQMACSSPRMLVWIGDVSACAQAAALFATELAGQIERKKHTIAPSAWIDKFAFACRAIIERPVIAYADHGGLTMLDLSGLEQKLHDHCGQGLLFQVTVKSLMELIQYLERRDQTLTYYGFDNSELRDFVKQMAGRSIDRIVPVGQALQFNRYWDGYDLMQEFSRRIYIGKDVTQVQNGRDGSGK